jgi:glycosyltransferase involved in cell wall biosynthesis
VKIAFVTQPWDEVVPSVGGSSSIAILTYQIARRLARSGEVFIYAKKGHSQQRVERDDEGIHYRRLSVATENWLLKLFKLLERLSGFRNPKRPFFASSLYYLGYALQVANDLRKQQCDVVHIHNFSQFVLVIRAFNPKVKIALHMHCEWLTQLDQAMIERRLRQADLVIGCSEYITEKVRRRFPQFASRCQTVFNGVDISQFVNQKGHSTAKKNGAKRLLFVGRVSPEKGIHVLLDAFQKVVERYPQVQLDIVGPGGNAPFEFVVLVSDDDKVSDLVSFYGRILRRGDYFSYLQRRLPSNLASRVTFAGSVPHSHVISYYREADVFIFPSIWNEPFGMPVVEAMASEVPVVATQGGGITEIVEEGQTGLLVERDNATALAEAILRLLENEGLRKSMGKAARQRAVEHFSWERTAESLLYQYGGICSQFAACSQ